MYLAYEKRLPASYWEPYCLIRDTDARYLLWITIDPPPGEGSWVLVRPINCSGDGTYDSGWPTQAAPRDATIAGSGAACP